MDTCDRGKQLKSYNPGLRRIRRGGRQSLFHWLINTVLVNSYLLSFYLDVDKTLKFQDQVVFQNALIQALFQAGKGVPQSRENEQIQVLITMVLLCQHIVIKWSIGAKRGTVETIRGRGIGRPLENELPWVKLHLI